MQNKKGPVHLPFLDLISCVNTVQQSITSGLEQRGRESSADLGLEHFQNTAALLNVPFPSSVCVCVSQ